MRHCARRFCGPLVLVALLSAAGPAAQAQAQELQLDPKALDPSGASSVKPAKVKKARAPQGTGDATGAKPAGAQQGGPNRQFGELEGWSPGKAPPKAEKDTRGGAAAPPKGAGIGMSPSGNMSVGLPF